MQHGHCVLGFPKGGSGLHAGAVWWRERRGVEKAEVPGEEDSEGKAEGFDPCLRFCLASNY